MSELIELIRCKPGFYAETGATTLQIEQAERVLGLRFAPDFKKCLHEFGAVSFDGHDLTGFSADQNLDIVTVTQKHREKAHVESNLYVIEEAHIDGIVVWQSPDGTIFETDRNYTCKKVADSFAQYFSV